MLSLDDGRFRMPTYIHRNSSDDQKTNISQIYRNQHYFEFHYKHTLYIALDFKFASASLENDMKMLGWLTNILEKSK